MTLPGLGQARPLPSPGHEAPGLITRSSWIGSHRANLATTQAGRRSDHGSWPDHGETSYLGKGRLTGLKALITGGDAGIGRAVSIAFAREGADVAFTYLSDRQADAEEVIRLVESAGRRVVPLPGDLVDRDVCERVVHQAVERLGGLDILVNNAGYHWPDTDGPSQRAAPADAERVASTNVHAIIWLTHAVLRYLQPGSSIINTSSTQARDLSTEAVDHAVKAVNNLTVTLAADLGARGIRVNAVAPGAICTSAEPRPPGTKAELIDDDTPLGRLGQPVECAPAYVFLASPAEASYVSGTVVGVTGGKPVF